ncbi:MAG: hypothetical protein AAF380_00125 [Bacteroidota bacterium]
MSRNKLLLIYLTLIAIPCQSKPKPHTNHTTSSKKTKLTKALVIAAGTALAVGGLFILSKKQNNSPSQPTGGNTPTPPNGSEKPNKTTETTGPEKIDETTGTTPNGKKPTGDNTPTPPNGSKKTKKTTETTGSGKKPTGGNTPTPPNGSKKTKKTTETTGSGKKPIGGTQPTGSGKPNQPAEPTPPTDLTKLTYIGAPNYDCNNYTANTTEQTQLSFVLVQIVEKPSNIKDAQRNIKEHREQFVNADENLACSYPPNTLKLAEIVLANNLIHNYGSHEAIEKTIKDNQWLVEDQEIENYDKEQKQKYDTHEEKVIQSMQKLHKDLDHNTINRLVNYLNQDEAKRKDEKNIKTIISNAEQAKNIGPQIETCLASIEALDKLLFDIRKEKRVAAQAEKDTIQKAKEEAEAQKKQAEQANNPLSIENQFDALIKNYTTLNCVIRNIKKDIKSFEQVKNTYAEDVELLNELCSFANPGENKDQAIKTLFNKKMNGIASEHSPLLAYGGMLSNCAKSADSLQKEAKNSNALLQPINQAIEAKQDELGIQGARKISGEFIDPKFYEPIWKAYNSSKKHIENTTKNMQKIDTKNFDESQGTDQQNVANRIACDINIFVTFIYMTTANGLSTENEKDTVLANASVQKLLPQLIKYRDRHTEILKYAQKNENWKQLDTLISNNEKITN